MTIARIWRCLTVATKCEQYLEYLNNCVVPAYQIAEGNEGLFVMQERQGEFAYFLLLSFWTSNEALENFAGANSCQMVNLTPEEKNLLIAFESTAIHYEILYRSASS